LDEKIRWLLGISAGVKWQDGLLSGSVEQRFKWCRCTGVANGSQSMFSPH